MWVQRPGGSNTRRIDRMQSRATRRRWLAGNLVPAMAAAPQVETVTITVNDIELIVPKGEIVVESVKRLGLEIPIFCYHPRMKPVGMCRMCIVEVGFKQPDGSVRKMPKPQAACTLPASEGMAVYTDTEMVHRDRRGVLEFLLINHPLDCPICDRGGECPLQNNTLFYGPSTSRFVELKRHLPKAFPLSKYVTLDLERCIQCGRCVRFTEEISGDAQLAFRFRGAEMQPSTFEMTDFDSKFSGNVIEICPVGALTNAKYRFRARPWDLETKPGICTVCSNGCNVWLDHRVGSIARVNGRTNEAVNEEWTCDRGKFGHGFYNEKRLTKPLIRRGDQLVQSDWAEAYSDVIRAFSAGGTAVAGLGGSRNSNEDLFMFRRLFHNQFQSPNLDHRFQSHLPSPADVESLNLAQKTIESYELESSMLVFGSSLADEEPILFLRARKAWFQNGARIVVAHHAPTDADSFAAVVLRYREGMGGALAASLLNAMGVSGYDKFAAEDVAEAIGVPAMRLREAAAILKNTKSPVITTRSLFNEPDGLETAKRLGALGGPLSIYGLEANDEGASRIGILPSAGGRNSHEIFEGCVDGSIRALWVLGVDPFEAFADRDLVERALGAVEFLVVQATNENGAFPFASVVLPMAAPAEQDGTYTNLEGRVQRMEAVVPPKGEAKPAWKVFSEIALRLKPQTPLFNVGEVMAELRREVPIYESPLSMSAPS